MEYQKRIRVRQELDKCLPPVLNSIIMEYTCDPLFDNLLSWHEKEYYLNRRFSIKSIHNDDYPRSQLEHISCNNHIKHDPQFQYLWIDEEYNQMLHDRLSYISRYKSTYQTKIYYRNQDRRKLYHSAYMKFCREMDRILPIIECYGQIRKSLEKNFLRKYIKCPSN